MAPPKLPIGDARYVVCDYKEIPAPKPKPSLPFFWKIIIMLSLVNILMNLFELGFELGIVYRGECFGSCPELLEPQG